GQEIVRPSQEGEASLARSWPRSGSPDLRSLRVAARRLRGLSRHTRKRLERVILERLTTRLAGFRLRRNARLYGEARCDARSDNTRCRFAGTSTGATGLEPAKTPHRDS